MKVQSFQVKAINVSLVYSIIVLMFIGHQVKGQDIQIMMPTQYDGKADSKELKYNESFYLYKASVESIIDLTQYQQYQPGINLPDSVKIILPELVNASDTTLLIGFIREKVTSTGHLVLLLATNYNTNEVTFYVDANLDGNYQNDGLPRTIIAGTPPTSIELIPENEEPIMLSLGVPKRKNSDELLKELKRKSKIRISNQFSLGGFAGVGVGKLAYDYDNIDTDYPTWYNVRFTERAIGANLNYETLKFRVGISATLTNHFYYTSYYNVQFAEPRGVRTGVLTERNIDSHSLNRFQIGGTVAYKIRMSQFSDIQPFITVGQLFYFSDSYFADNRPNKEIAYSLSPNYFYELGLRLDFTVGNEKSIFLDIASNSLQWRPDNFLAEINLTNLGIKHQTWKINLGYRISL